MCQVYATMEVLTRPNMSSSFMILFPIQLAALLMTCVRKSIITAGGWHVLYTCALLSGFVYSYLNNENMKMNKLTFIIYNGCIWFYLLVRFKFQIDKYKLWSIIIAIVTIKQICDNEYNI